MRDEDRPTGLQKILQFSIFGVRKQGLVESANDRLVIADFVVDVSLIELGPMHGLQLCQHFVAVSLKADGDKMLAKLKAMHGAEFDKAYIDNEVSYHESVIGALDKTLLPNAKNAELKNLLETGRPIFVSHLEHAKQLQKSLSK